MKMYINMKELELELVLESIRNKANVYIYVFFASDTFYRR